MRRSPARENPDLVYVVSSHYDSALVSPGADDDSSGTAALLETARLLAGHPQPATIVFASFTGEEGGLFGSREFARRAVADKLHIVGALNNDMVGWANDERLDDTIRYSNAGIRDLQHAAAIQFSKLITYDAHYYKNTDAAAYYEAYGDIVGGIGSYPVLGSPHYHQPHDLLETINHQLVTEVAKTTAASVMLLASSPSRIDGLEVTSFSNGTAAIAWKPSAERGVTGYLVSGGRAPAVSKPMRVSEPSARITGVKPGAEISVKAVNAKGWKDGTGPRRWSSEVTADRIRPNTARWLRSLWASAGTPHILHGRTLTTGKSNRTCRWHEPVQRAQRRCRPCGRNT